MPNNDRKRKDHKDDDRDSSPPTSGRCIWIWNKQLNTITHSTASNCEECGYFARHVGVGMEERGGTFEDAERERLRHLVSRQQYELLVTELGDARAEEGAWRSDCQAAEKRVKKLERDIERMKEALQKAEDENLRLKRAAGEDRMSSEEDASRASSKRRKHDDTTGDIHQAQHTPSTNEGVDLPHADASHGQYYRGTGGYAADAQSMRGGMQGRGTPYRGTATARGRGNFPRGGRTFPTIDRHWANAYQPQANTPSLSERMDTTEPSTPATASLGSRMSAAPATGTPSGPRVRPTAPAKKQKLGKAARKRAFHEEQSDWSDGSEAAAGAEEYDRETAAMAETDIGRQLAARAAAAPHFGGGRDIQWINPQNNAQLHYLLKYLDTNQDIALVQHMSYLTGLAQNTPEEERSPMQRSLINCWRKPAWSKPPPPAVLPQKQVLQIKVAKKLNLFDKNGSPDMIVGDVGQPNDFSHPEVWDAGLYGLRTHGENRNYPLGVVVATGFYGINPRTIRAHLRLGPVIRVPTGTVVGGDILPRRNMLRHAVLRILAIPGDYARLLREYETNIATPNWDSNQTPKVLDEREAVAILAGAGLSLQEADDFWIWAYSAMIQLSERGAPDSMPRVDAHNFLIDHPMESLVDPWNSDRENAVTYVLRDRRWITQYGVADTSTTPEVPIVVDAHDEQPDRTITEDMHVDGAVVEEDDDTPGSPTGLDTVEIHDESGLSDSPGMARGTPLPDLDYDPLTLEESDFGGLSSSTPSRSMSDIEFHEEFGEFFHQTTPEPE